MGECFLNGSIFTAFRTHVIVHTYIKIVKKLKKVDINRRYAGKKGGDQETTDAV